MSNDWIYVGANIEDPNWSKVGKTTIGLETRDVSSQAPSYIIYRAFNIIKGDVHKIESDLLQHLTTEQELERLRHMSTGRPSECFRLNPDEMAGIVEVFIDAYYPECVRYEHTTHGFMSRYECNQSIQSFFVHDDSAPETISHLKMTRDKYFTGNHEKYEIELDNGVYMDLSSGTIKDRTADIDHNDDK